MVGRILGRSLCCPYHANHQLPTIRNIMLWGIVLLQSYLFTAESSTETFPEVLAHEAVYDRVDGTVDVAKDMSRNACHIEGVGIVTKTEVIDEVNTVNGKPADGKSCNNRQNL